MSTKDALVVRMEATLSKFEKQMQRAVTVGRRSSTDIEKRFDKMGTRMAASSNRAATGLTRVMNISGRGRFVLQNTAAQFGDIAVQLEGGTAASRVMAQQLPQLLGGFGALGGALGIVAPLLGTVAAVGIPIAALFLANGRASKGLADSTQSLTDAIKEYVAAAEAANITTEELREKYGTAEGAARTFIATLREIEGVEAIEALEGSIDGLVAKFGSFAADDLLSFGSLDGVYTEFERLTGLIETTPDVNESLRLDLARTALTEYISALDDLQTNLGLSSADAIKVGAALADLGQANGPRQQARAAEDLLASLEAALGPYADMSSAAREIYAEVRQIGVAAAEMQGAVEGSATAARELVGAIHSVAGSSMSGLIGEADALTGSLRTAASAAWDALSAITQAAHVRQQLESGAVGPDAAVNDVRNRLTSSGVSRDSIVFQRRYAGPGSGSRASRSGGGASGGGGASLPDLFADTGAAITAMEREIDMIGKTAAEVAGLTAKFELLDEAKRRNLDLDARSAQTGETLAQQIDRQAQSITDLTRRSEEYAERADFVAEKSDQLRTGFVDAMIEGENLSGVLSQLALDLAKAAARAALFGDGPFGGSGGGLIGAIFPALAGARASGGGTRSGSPYLVNENTPNSEVFVPSQNGAVLNVPQAQAALRQAASGGGASVVRIELGEGLQARILQQSAQQAIRIAAAGDAVSRQRLPRDVAGMMDERGLR